jgi:segregation and condensation protein A
MELSLLGHQNQGYTVRVPVYEGPLDLLLQLIEHSELDITKVALAVVTDQYLEYIRAMQAVGADEISAFLVIAAKLIQIKSEALLPRPPVREVGEEDPGEALARQLQLYKRFKEIALTLNERQQKNLRTYLRVAPPPKVESKLDLSNISLGDLMDAALRVFTREKEKQSLGTVISAPRVTIREKIGHIVHMMKSSRMMTFKGLINQAQSRVEIVVTFLALLELVKRYAVEAKQDTVFGDIQIETMIDLQADQEFELEFE